MALPGLYDCFQHWGEKNAVWAISDTHFGDKDIQKAFPNRPSDEDLIKSINQKVGKAGTLLLLGDVGDINYAKQLKGYKILVMGNHDLGRSNYERKIIKEVYDQDNYTRDEVIADMRKKYSGWQIWVTEEYDFHAPFKRWIGHADNCLFDEIYEGALIIGEKLILSHEPIDKIDWAVNLHGHNHNGSKKKDYYHFNVCADVIGYTPINFNQLLKSGIASKIQTIHRTAINLAIDHKKKRGGRKIGEK